MESELTSRRLVIAVIGDAGVGPGSAAYEIATEVGRLIVDSGARVLCGGLGGVMEAACRGAHGSSRYVDGDTVGLLPGFDPAAANPWVDIVIPTGLDHMRNALVGGADSLVVIGGGAGTLSEMAFGWMLKRPIVALGVDGWGARLQGLPLDARRSPDAAEGDVVIAASSAEQAVAIAIERGRRATARHKAVVRRPT